MPSSNPRLGPALLAIALAVAGLLIGVSGAAAPPEEGAEAAVMAAAGTRLVECDTSRCTTVLVIEPGVFIPYDNIGEPIVR